MNLKRYKQRLANLEATSDQPWLRTPVLRDLDDLIQEVERLQNEKLLNPVSKSGSKSNANLTPITMKEWAKYIYDWCERKGWNTGLVTGNQIANCHSELSEAWEEIRSGHSETEVYLSGDSKPEGFPIELADTIIRILHIAHRFGLNMDELIAHKMSYNETRPYRHGGKTA